MRSRAICGMFCASLVGALAMQYPTMTHGCFSGFGVPACDASMVSFKKAIDLDDQPFGITALQFQDVLQTAFEGVTRSCWGRVYRSNGTDHAYRYQFRLANRNLETAVQYADW